MTKIKKIRTGDVLAAVVCLTTLAFHDVKIAVIMSQILFAVYLFIVNTHHFKLTIPAGSQRYLFRYSAFLLVSIISYTWSLNKSEWLVAILAISQCIILGVSIIYYIREDTKIVFLTRSILFASLVLCVRLFVSVPKSAWGTERVGIYINYGYVSVSYVLASASIIALYYALREKKMLDFLLTVIFVFVSALTGTKKGVVVFIVGAAVILLKMVKSPVKILRNVFVVLTVAAILCFLIMKVDILYNAVGKRFVSSINQIYGTGIDKSTRDRALLIEWGLDTFGLNPLVGVGIDGFKSSPYNLIHYYAHNNYVELLADLGLLGTFLYYCPLIKDITTHIRNTTIRDWELLGLAILVSLLIGDLTSVSYSQESLQLYLAFACGIFRLEENKNEI